MINPKELRIGNLIFCTTTQSIAVVQSPHPGKVVVALKYENISADHATTDLKELEPVTLTPEWLEKLGFKYHYSRSACYRYWFLEEITVELSNERGGGFELMGSEWPVGKPFRFVHQLQNIYFLLTGQELTIKRPEIITRP